MATIQKGAKINFYKFVPVTLATASTANPDDSNPKLTQAVLTNVKAVNNLGGTVNSLAKVVVDIKKITHASLTAEQAARQKLPKAKYNKPNVQFGNFFKKLSMGKVPGFLESLLKLLAGLFKLTIGRAILKWFANPENRKKIERGIEVVAKIGKIIQKWAEFGTSNAFNGLYKMLSDESTWWERLQGFGQFLVGFGTLALGFRWLNPLNIVRTTKELKTIVTLFGTAIRSAFVKMSALLKGPLGWMFLAVGAGVVTGKLLVDNARQREEERGAGRFYEGKFYYPGDPMYDKIPELHSKEKGAFGQIWDFLTGKGDRHQVTPQTLYRAPGTLGPDDPGVGVGGPNDPNRYKAWGGSLNNLKEFAGGGWIHGPQSGYPVSLDGKGTDFIGHGSEYVARKGDGSAFIVPFDTKATRTNPNLTETRIREAKSMGYDIGGLSAAIGGMVDKKIYLHWTGTGYGYSPKGHFHSVFSGDGRKKQGVDYNKTGSHTWKRNKNSIGLAASAMGGRPWIDYPPTIAQKTAMMMEAARIAKSWGWKGEDVSVKNVMTGAEAASNRDGGNSHENYGPVEWGGTGERWDFFKTTKRGAPGSGGNELRAMMRAFMAKGQGGKGRSTQTEMDLLQRLVLAEARGEGVLGMALVARSVMNRAGIIQDGAAPGLFNAKGGSITDIIMGKGQYQPIRDGSINAERSPREMDNAMRAIMLAKNPKALRNRLIAAGYDDATVNKLLGATGFRTGGAFLDKSQQVNTTKHGNHIFNSAGNENLRILNPSMGLDGNRRTSGGGGVRSFVDSKANMSGGVGNIFRALTGGGGMRSGGGNTTNRLFGNANAKGNATTGNQDTAAMRKATDQRNAARKEMNRRTIEIVQQALAQIETSNQATKGWIEQANAAATAILGQSDKPTYIGGGGGGGGSAGPFTSTKANGIFGIATKVLNSFNNPLRGLFK
tara:strand:- start:393 stop:3218 length:2826 start_codon:yes stop_codon:yes gene_type:complete